MTTSQEALTRLIDGLTDHAGNLAPGSVYLDQLAPVIRNGEDGLELVKARWGMPSSPSVLETARDPGVTNVRNLGSPHWRRWLGQGHRCLVPVTSFSEPRGKGQGVQWFAPADEDTTMFFAGIETRGWTSLRKVKDGETTDLAIAPCLPADWPGYSARLCVGGTHITVTVQRGDNPSGCPDRCACAIVPLVGERHEIVLTVPGEVGGYRIPFSPPPPDPGASPVLSELGGCERPETYPKKPRL